MPSLQTVPVRDTTTSTTIGSPTTNKSMDQSDDRMVGITESVGPPSSTDNSNNNIGPTTSHDTDELNDENEEFSTVGTTATTTKLPPGQNQAVGGTKKVTPSDDEKPAQQKKVQQLSLSSFFLPNNRNDISTTTTEKKAKKSSTTTTTTPSSSSSSTNRGASRSDGPEPTPSSSSSSTQRQTHIGSQVNPSSSSHNAVSSSKNNNSIIDLTDTSPIRPRRTDNDGDDDNVDDNVDGRSTETTDHVVKTSTATATSNDNSMEKSSSKRRTTTSSSSSTTAHQPPPSKETVVGLASAVHRAVQASSSLLASGSSKDSTTTTTTTESSPSSPTVTQLLQAGIEASIEQVVEESSSSNDGTSSSDTLSKTSQQQRPMDAFLQSFVASSKQKSKTTQSKSKSKQKNNAASNTKTSSTKTKLTGKSGKGTTAKATTATNNNPKKKTTKKATSTKSQQQPPIPPPPSVPVDKLSHDLKTLHDKYTTLQTKYTQRVQEIVTNSCHGLDVEQYDRVPLEVSSLEQSNGGNDNDTDSLFPAVVTSNMCVLIEGSKLPLSALTLHVTSELTKVHTKEFPVDIVGDKIKVLAERKSYFDESSAQTKSSATIDLYEDTTINRLWRWEVTTLDLLPLDAVAPARKARMALRKVSNHRSSLFKLLKSINDILTKIVDPSQPKLDDSISKISQAEEKVLKFEREAEKQRLAEEAKIRKAQEIEAKKRLKEAAAEEKRRKKEEETEKKKEVAKSREEAKRKKDEEKEQLEAEKKMADEKKRKHLDMQKSSFMSFFSAPKKVKASETTSVIDQERTVVADKTPPNVEFDREKFRCQINSMTSDDVESSLNSMFGCNTRPKRRLRTEKVPVSILTTVQPNENDGWDVPSYSEKKTIHVLNKYIFLSFHEDCRPPYHGTWNKQSSVISGRTPFRKDTFFDYDYDSEAEWEEGDDEVGEDVEDEGKDLEEEADDPIARAYDYDDGFCVADDKFLENEEDADDETKAMYKKKLQKDGYQPAVNVNQIQIIAPVHGGIPLRAATDKIDGCVEGFEHAQVHELLAPLKAQVLSGLKLYVDAFPQLDVDFEQPPEADAPPSSLGKDEYSPEYVTTMARFVHHNTVNSKEKLIDELKSSNPTLYLVRAKAMRKLEAIAVKKKHPSLNGTYYWEVNNDVLVEHGLTDVIERRLVVAPPIDSIIGVVKGSVATDTKRKCAEPSNSDEMPTKKLKTPTDKEKKSKDEKPPQSSKQQKLMMSFLKSSTNTSPELQPSK